MRLAWMLPCSLCMVVARPALADEPAGPPGAPGAATQVTPARQAPQPMRKDIVITTERDRDGKNVALLASIAGAGAILAGVGVYYNLDSRDAAASVSPKMATGAAWTAARQADYDRAHTSGVKAGIFYGLGGAALITATVMLIATAPGTETTVIHPHYAPTVAPTPGGAVLGGAWSF
jgi:hypothetical protein